MGRKWKTRIASKFPVHPEVVLAKKVLMAAFSAKPFDHEAYASAARRLKALVRKYHPRSTRPAQQRDEAFSWNRRVVKARPGWATGTDLYRWETRG